MLALVPARFGLLKNEPVHENRLKKKAILERMQMKKSTVMCHEYFVNASLGRQMWRQALCAL